MDTSLTPLRRLAKLIHPHLRGWLAEKLALGYYMARGFLPIRHVRQALAQTDLILIRGDLILLVEVKFRSSQGRGHVALTTGQRQRLNRQMLAIAGKYPGYTIRLEVFLVFPHRPFWQRIPNPFYNDVVS
jgi:Holliday junction resolvase-like predicted endonuclease